MIKKIIINGQSVLSLKLKREIWYKAVHIAELLGYSNTERAIRDQVSIQHKKLSTQLINNGQILKENKIKFQIIVIL